MTILTINHAKLASEVAKHIAADAVVQGEYWNGTHGCFIGCLAHSSNASFLEREYGLPEPLVRICENIFEGLAPDEAKAFFAAIPDAVGRDGKDLSRVHWAFLASELRALPKVPDDIQAVIDPVISGMDLLAAGGKWSADAARADAIAAYAARAAYADAARAAAIAAASADAAYADPRRRLRRRLRRRRRHPTPPTPTPTPRPTPPSRLRRRPQASARHYTQPYQSSVKGETDDPPVQSR
jgi:hypothetical protein